MADVGRPLGLRVGEEHLFGLAVRLVGGRRAHRVFRQGALGVLVRVVDEETAVRRVVGVECEAEEALFDAVGEHPVGDVEEGLLGDGAVGSDEFDPPDPLGDEEPIVYFVRANAGNWLAEATITGPAGIRGEEPMQGNPGGPGGGRS